MKSVLKLIVVMMITVLPAFASAKTCGQMKAFLIREINSAIATYPNSCALLAVPFQCNVLFNTKLPQLRGVVTNNEFDKLKLVVQGINDNITIIRSIVADDYKAPMNTLISDINTYNRHCGR